MSVSRRGNSQNFYVQFRLAGRTIIRSARTGNRRAAEQFEAQLRAQIHAQVFLGEKPRIRLSDAFALFARCKEGTANHKNILGHIRTISATVPDCDYLDQLSLEHMERYLDGRRRGGIAPQTQKNGLAVISGTIKLARQRRFRVPDLQLPSVKVANGRLRYLSTEEERLLLKALDPMRQGPGLYRSPNREPELRQQLQDLHDLVVLLLDTGARCSEIRRLRWQHIDLEAGIIHLWRPKVSNESVLFITRRSHTILQRRKLTATSEYLFANKYGGMRNHTHSSWRKAFNRAGLSDCTIHTIRHTHASRLIQNGLSVYEVQTVLGHSDPKTTMRYAHLEQAAVTAKARTVMDNIHTQQDERAAQLEVSISC